MQSYVRTPRARCWVSRHEHDSSPHRRRRGSKHGTLHCVPVCVCVCVCLSRAIAAGRQAGRSSQARAPFSLQPRGQTCEVLVDEQLQVRAWRATRGAHELVPARIRAMAMSTRARSVYYYSTVVPVPGSNTQLESMAGCGWGGFCRQGPVP